MFRTVMATAAVTLNFIPLISSIMAGDLILFETDLNDTDAVVLRLIKTGYSVQSISYCFTSAILTAKEAKQNAAKFN